MMDLIKWSKILFAILKDGKITKEEVPAFMEALAGVIVALVAIVLPFIKGDASVMAKRLSAGVSLAAKKS